VPRALDGERLDRAVALAAGVSRRQAGELVASGRVAVAGEVVTSGARRVRLGQTVAVDVPPPAEEGPLPADPGVEVPVVYVDEHLVVVDKPAGVAVHPGAGRASGTLVQGLLARFPDLASLGGEDPERPGIVHRLDIGTSGLLVVARTAAARASLAAQLSARAMRREYLGLAIGSVGSRSGLIDAPLGRSPADPTRVRVQAGGREARTRYEVVARHDLPAPTTLLRLALDTGRTHQIRAHLSSIGHPVLGDDRYGGRPSGGPLTPVAALLGEGRPFLHAATLTFEHPASGDHVQFTSPLPADLVAVLEVLGPPTRQDGPQRGGPMR
jgi:23S rRNA pseudouridine1911/1915/1917 synthase